MTANQIIALCVRLFAIFLAVQIVSFFLQNVTFLDTSPTPKLWYLVYLMIGIIVLIALTIFLWKFPHTVAKKIYNVDDEKIDASWSTDELYVVGFVLLGVFYLYRAIADIFYWILYIIAFHQTSPYWEETISTENKVYMISTGFEFILALALIFGAKSLKKIVFKIRYWKVRKHND